MIACGVDIKSKDAILALVKSSLEESIHLGCSTKKLTLADDRDVQSILVLKSAIIAFVEQNSVDTFVIKSRQGRGQSAAGGITFKIETLFQLSGCAVEFVSPPTLAKFGRSNLGGIPSTVLAYQADAFRAAAWRVSQIQDH